MKTPVTRLFAPSGLSLVLVVLSTFALTACSQNKKPEAEAAPATPPAQPAAQEPVAAAAPVAKPREKKPQEAPQPAPAGVAQQQETPAAATPAPAAPAVAAPESAKPFVPSAPGKRIAHVHVPGPYVAVTFDDGPSASLTPRVLDIFNSHGAHATFFVQGQNAAHNRSLLARAAAEGHEIGSHTWNHINMGTSSTATIVNQLDRTAEVIEQATGRRPKVMRPPYGSINSSLVNLVYNRYGTPAILWDVDTNDWRKPGVQTVVNRAVNGARPGSIILLHDIHASTVEAVEGIVTGLQARGFKLVTVSELIALGGGRATAAAAPLPEAAEPAPSAGQPAAPAESVSQETAGAASIGTAPEVPAAAAEPVAEAPAPAPATPAEAPAAEENPLLYDDLY